MDIDRSTKSFLAAVQMGCESGLDSSVGSGNAEK